MVSFARQRSGRVVVEVGASRGGGYRVVARIGREARVTKKVLNRAPSRAKIKSLAQPGV
jgi:hypothetical protein